MSWTKIASICLLTITVAVANPLNPFLCSCGLGPGTDMCMKKDCSPLIVRPHEVPKPIPAGPKVVCQTILPAGPLVPKAGPCTCHTSFVKPAVVPKPTCQLCCNSDQSSQLTLNQNQNFQFGALSQNPVILTNANQRPIYVDDIVSPVAVGPAALAPADPISLQIAYNKAHESCVHNEDRLAFGFRTLPKELPTKPKIVNNIPEEQLFNLNGQIVELKHIGCSDGKSLDEEAAEVLLDLSDETEIGGPVDVRRVSLGEIGYGPAKIKSAPFVSLPANAAPADEVVPNVPSNDGFVPGKVVISHPTIPEYYTPRPVFAPPCEDEDNSEELPFPPFPALPPNSLAPAVSSYGNPLIYGSASSSSSSSSRQNQNYNYNVILQKLGCN